MAEINFRKTHRVSKKGVARRRNVPLLYNEVKSKLNLSLTPSTIDSLTKKAIDLNTSISEMIERWVRKSFIVLSLTPSTMDRLTKEAESTGISIDEQVECWVRGWNTPSE